MCAGLRLDDAGTEALSWLDLWAFCFHSPPDSALFQALNPNYLSYVELASRSMEYSLRWLQWSKTKDGQKGRNIPDPWPLPGAKPEAEFDQSEYVPMSFDEMDDWLASKREG